MSNSAEEERDALEMETSCFSQVVFLDVPRSFPPNTSVKCTYIVTGGLEPSSRDWIAIFKVGWSSTQKYHNYVWVKPLEHSGTEPLKLQVVFDEYYLPKDDGEFYQFCYVDSSGQVKGTSTPFCFQNTADSSLPCSLEKDLLVITTQEQAEQMEKEKKNLLSETEHLKEENLILKNELDERLREIYRLRVHIDKLKSSSAAEMQKVESFEQDTTEQQPLSHTMAENEPKQESLTVPSDKYDKAVQKITHLKQEKIMLQQQLEAKQAEISQLSQKVKETEQDLNRLQDHFQLLQVDVQSSRKENERLHVEIQELMGMKKEVEELRADKALRATLSEQGSFDEDKSNKKVQIQTLMMQLTEARGTLRKEIANSNEAHRRADKAELELRELKKELEQKALTKERSNSHTEMQLEEAQRTINEQANMAKVVQLEKENLFDENKDLKANVARLQTQLYDLQVAAVAAASKPQHSPLNPPLTDPFSTQQQPQSASNYYENITELSGNLTGMENKKCRHCHESFPDISEDELAMHEQSHKVCPFCTLICDDLGQQEFEDHVYGHE